MNAGVAVRARPADFAKWGEHGAEGWSFADVDSDALDLHITATHLLDGSFSPTGGAIVLATALAPRFAPAVPTTSWRLP